MNVIFIIFRANFSLNSPTFDCYRFIMLLRYFFQGNIEWFERRESKSCLMNDCLHAQMLSEVLFYAPVSRMVIIRLNLRLKIGILIKKIFFNCRFFAF